MDRSAPPLTGLIDIHSHLLPGVDDGCLDIEDSIACIELLQQRGFIGSICTPHIWPDMYPANTTEHVQGYVHALRRELAERGVEYIVWCGGEMRLFNRCIDWFKQHGVPTLASSKCVLVDLWETRWPRWANGVFDWLIAEGYQPVLAHPERMRIRNLDKLLRDLESRGVWLQGNVRPITGEEGFDAGKVFRQLMTEGRYHFLALDMHGYDNLPNRLDGLALVEAEFGPDPVQHLLHDAPRELIPGLATAM